MGKKDKDTVAFLITGGHLTPAKAVVDKLQKRKYTNFIWVGRKYTMKGDANVSAEYQLIHKDLGIPFFSLSTGKVIRFWNVRSFLDFLSNLVKIPFGFLCAFWILLKSRPHIIISFGGYIALPIVIMAYLMRIQIVTHEQTVVVGLANKVIGKFAHKILISWEENKKFFPPAKVVLTGNPLREEVFKSTSESFTINPKLPTIYITCGNQGAHIINTVVLEIIDSLVKRYNVIHQTGLTSLTMDYEKCRKVARHYIDSRKGKYIVRGAIFSHEIGEVFAKANLIIMRSGANTVTEVLALGKMAIMTPIPWSVNNEQLKNAQMVERTGLGEIIEQKNLTAARLLQTIDEGIKLYKQKKDFHKKSLIKAQKKAQAMINLNAAEGIVDELEKMI